MAIVFLLLCIYVIISLYVSRYYITTTTYVYESDKISSPVKIAVLTDEHSNYFGKDNSKLLQKVGKLKPDYIAVVGDAINSYSPNESFLEESIKSLKDIAPVYYALGNHENSYLAIQNFESSQIMDVIENSGGTYLEQSYIDLSVNGSEIRIGGLFDYLFNKANVPLEQYVQKDSYKFLQSFTDTDSFKILLSHRPESLITNDEDSAWDIDLALSGHEHGGQVRLPFVGGFYSTHLGLFSPYIDGYQIINGIPTVISKGLGTYYSKRTPPRFNNPPEIVVISLT